MTTVEVQRAALFNGDGFEFRLFQRFDLPDAFYLTDVQWDLLLSLP